MLRIFVLAVVLSTLAGCGVNSVTKNQLEAVKTGDILVYRYKKPDGKSWFYADKIRRIEGETVYYSPSKSEATAGNDSRLKVFDLDTELSMPKQNLLQYETEQGEEKKVIIWIL
jgi:hypothetical protein